MSIRVAINGYGRIGRNILRSHYEGGKKHGIEIRIRHTVSGYRVDFFVIDL